MNDRRLAPSLSPPSPRLRRTGRRLAFFRVPTLPWRMLVIAFLTIAANELFWRHRVGISLPSYAGLLCLGIITNARRLGSLRWFWFTLALLAGSILAGANATSFSNFVSVSVLLTALFGICFLPSPEAAPIDSAGDPEFCRDPLPLVASRFGYVSAVLSQRTSQTRLEALATNNSCEVHRRSTHLCC